MQLNNITFSLENNEYSKVPESFRPRIYSGTRNNVYRVDFFDSEHKAIQQQIDSINSVRDEKIPHPVNNVKDLTRFIVSFNQLPDRISPESGGEYRVPFISYKFASNRQTFENFTITFIEPLGLFIKAIFRWYMFAYIINPWYNIIAEQKNYKFIIKVTHYSNVVFKDNDKLLTLSDTPEIPRRVFTFYGVFPVSVNGVQIQYDSTEQIYTDVTFSYDYFEVNDDLVKTDVVWNEMVEQKHLIY